jgi:hypothetical protein
MEQDRERVKLKSNEAASIIVPIFPDGRMTANSAARYIGVSEQTLALWRVLGKGPAFVSTGRIYYFKDAIDEWLADRTFKSTAQARRKPDGRKR